MKKRSEGFLSEEKINQNSEQFDYIRELHDYLWQFVRCELPGANGRLDDYLDIALENAKRRCVCKGGAKGRTVTPDYENRICEQCGKIEK